MTKQSRGVGIDIQRLLRFARNDTEEPTNALNIWKFEIAIYLRFRYWDLDFPMDWVRVSFLQA